MIEKLDDTRPAETDPVRDSVDYIRETRRKINEIIDKLNRAEMRRLL